MPCMVDGGHREEVETFCPLLSRGSLPRRDSSMWTGGYKWVAWRPWPRSVWCVLKKAEYKVFSRACTLWFNKEPPHYVSFSCFYDLPGPLKAFESVTLSSVVSEAQNIRIRTALKAGVETSFCRQEKWRRTRCSPGVWGLWGVVTEPGDGPWSTSVALSFLASNPTGRLW